MNAHRRQPGDCHIRTKGRKRTHAWEINLDPIVYERGNKDDSLAVDR